MSFYAKSPIKHNGTMYPKGAEVPLEGEAAERLVEKGVLQTEPIPKEELPKEPAPSTDENPAGPEAGGNEPTETGEPSQDGQPGGGQAQGGILGKVFGSKDGATPPQQ